MHLAIRAGDAGFIRGFDKALSPGKAASWEAGLVRLFVEPMSAADLAKIDAGLRDPNAGTARLDQLTNAFYDLDDLDHNPDHQHGLRGVIGNYVCDLAIDELRSHDVDPSVLDDAASLAIRLDRYTELVDAVNENSKIISKPGILPITLERLYSAALSSRDATLKSALRKLTNDRELLSTYDLDDVLFDLATGDENQMRADLKKLDGIPDKALPFNSANPPPPSDWLPETLHEVRLFASNQKTPLTSLSWLPNVASIRLLMAAPDTSFDSNFESTTIFDLKYSLPITYRAWVIASERDTLGEYRYQTTSPIFNAIASDPKSVFAADMARRFPAGPGNFNGTISTLAVHSLAQDELPLDITSQLQINIDSQGGVTGSITSGDMTWSLLGSYKDERIYGKASSPTMKHSTLWDLLKNG